VIRILRCTEPAELQLVRQARLATLRSLALVREPTSKDIDGYKIVAEQLWRSQYHKCCYCESKVPKAFNDVEHYRPKGEADRLPASNSTHGYWWLAFDWDNLLFACPGCNRSGKNSKFPLAPGSVPLIAEQMPPGNEVALLIDPTADNPIEHIEYKFASTAGVGGVFYWWARPRKNSLLGNETIAVCELNRIDLLELRNDYVRDILSRQVKALSKALNEGNRERAEEEYENSIGLLASSNTYVGLAFDVLRTEISSRKLKLLIGRGWPSPRYFR